MRYFKIFGLIFFGFLIGTVSFMLKSSFKSATLIDPISLVEKKPLEEYQFKNLKKRNFPPSNIILGKVIKQTQEYESRMFYFNTKNIVTGKEEKNSGLMNIPVKSGDLYPVLILIRGYVDEEIYEPGVGTKHFGEYAVSQGYVTLAPDFLGYGESDKPSVQSIEERFQTYVTTLTLISSVNNLNFSFEKEKIAVRIDADKIGIWGHSNGGQIALSVLEISKKEMPTVLWAPVSKPFPYSILYYTDEFEDRGRVLRKVVAAFEKDYNADNYSMTNYLGLIKSPIQIHQGGIDEAVPQKWSDQLADELKKIKRQVEYFTYPYENHNFNNGYWDQAAGRSLSFYNRFFKE